MKDSSSALHCCCRMHGDASASMQHSRRGPHLHHQGVESCTGTYSRNGAFWHDLGLVACASLQLPGGISLSSSWSSLGPHVLPANDCSRAFESVFGQSSTERHSTTLFLPSKWVVYMTLWALPPITRVPQIWLMSIYGKQMVNGFMPLPSLFKILRGSLSALSSGFVLPPSLPLVLRAPSLKHLAATLPIMRMSCSTILLRIIFLLRKVILQHLQPSAIDYWQSIVKQGTTVLSTMRD